MTYDFRYKLPPLGFHFCSFYRTCGPSRNFILRYNCHDIRSKLYKMPLQLNADSRSHTVCQPLIHTTTFVSPSQRDRFICRTRFYQIVVVISVDRPSYFLLFTLSHPSQVHYFSYTRNPRLFGPGSSNEMDIYWKPSTKLEIFRVERVTIVFLFFLMECFTTTVFLGCRCRKLCHTRESVIVNNSNNPSTLVLPFIDDTGHFPQT